MPPQHIAGPSFIPPRWPLPFGLSWGVCDVMKRVVLAAMVFWGVAQAQSLRPAAAPASQPVLAAQSTAPLHTATTHTPKRVVSLLPSTTELICHLGTCERLVGVDHHSNHPQTVRHLPQLGRLGAWSIESLVKLQPDWVFIPRDAQLAKRLRTLGIGHQVVDPQNFNEVERSFSDVAQALGLGAERGTQLWREVQQELNQVRHSLPAHTVGQRVYIEVDSAGFVAGPASYLGQLVTRLGLVNAMDAPEPAYPQLSPEWVLRHQPDWLLLLSLAATPVAQRPGWSKLRAVQAQRVCQYAPKEVDVLVRPGPRVAEAARLLAQCVKGVHGAR